MKTSADQTMLFESKPVFRAIMELAFPSIIGQIILVIYNMADTFFVGLTNSDVQMSAVTVCMPAFMLLSAISNLFGVGGASVISRFLGVGNREKARLSSSFAIWGCCAVAAFYSLAAYLFSDLFVDLLGGMNTQVHVQARIYLLTAICAGGVVTSMNTLFSHLIRAEGRSTEAGLGIVLGGVLNIILDPLFMFVIFEPGNEVFGAALATALSNAVALVYFLIVMWHGRSISVLSVRPKRRMLRDGIPGRVISAGIPACVMTLFENISYAVLDNLMAAGGIACQAGIGVAKKVNMLAHSVVRGMTQGVLPLIGYNYASGNTRRMKRTVRLSAAMSIGISTMCMTACMLFASTLVGIFLPAEGASHALAARFLRILCIGAPFSAWAYTVISFFQATGQTGKSLILALLRKGILDIPFMMILGRLYLSNGLVAATPVADILCCVTALCTYLRFMHRHSAAGATRGQDVLAE